MPFLLPALVALPSDAVILFLGLGLSPVSAIRDDDADGVSSSSGGEEDTEEGHSSSHRHCTYRSHNRRTLTDATYATAHGSSTSCSSFGMFASRKTKQGCTGSTT
jgi:hypothetical protein